MMGGYAKNLAQQLSICMSHAGNLDTRPERWAFNYVFSRGGYKWRAVWDDFRNWALGLQTAESHEIGPDDLRP
jgi:hypothetical protein